MDMQSAIRAVTENQDLDTAQMTAVMRLIMSGQATPAQIGGFLIGLRMKGETVSEITAAAKVMRELAIHVDVTEPHLVDTCGTGGDGVGTFNISTAAAFVVAAAGGKVAKHGNRSVSSKSGSADVLELAGVNLALTPAQVAQCIEQVGVGFLFAPQHHSAMKHAIGPRREMGVRTLFNLLGPLTNPAGALHQVMGVFSQQWLQALAEVFAQLGSRHVLVVHADDGMDEISIGSATQVAELNQGQITRYSITPEQFGMTRGDVKALAVSNAGQSLEIIHKVLKGEPSTAADIVALNAGAAIYAADIEASLEAGVKRAQHVLSSGTAFAKLNDLLDLTQSFQA